MNLNLKILENKEVNYIDQIIKIDEEYRELVRAALKLKRDNEIKEDREAENNLIEEALDLIQATINLVDIYNLANRLEAGIVDHYKKLDSRGWEYKNI